jgi:hypothetical protein
LNVGTVTITTDGTYDGTTDHEIMTVFGYPVIVIISLDGTPVTHVAGTATGDVIVVGITTTVGT